MNHEEESNDIMKDMFSAIKLHFNGKIPNLLSANKNKLSVQSLIESKNQDRYQSPKTNNIKNEQIDQNKIYDIDSIYNRHNNNKNVLFQLCEDFIIMNSSEKKKYKEDDL